MNQEYLDVILGKAKTVTKTLHFHGNDNIVLVFRSMEVFCVKDDQNAASRSAKLKPIYIPVDLMSKLYRYSAKELLKTLFYHINFSKNGEIKLDYEKLKATLDESSKASSNVNEFVEPENGVISTSYMYNDTDYIVTIKYPYLGKFLLFLIKNRVQQHIQKCDRDKVTHN